MILEGGGVWSGRPERYKTEELEATDDGLPGSYVSA